MAGRIIAIGDIHGCSTALSTVLNAITPMQEDTIIVLGDYVDRGPDSKGVLEILLALQKQCELITLFGNHEEMMLSVINGADPHWWLKYGGIDTLDSYGFSGNMEVIPTAHVQFLENCLDYYETETHFFVHANYDSRLPLSKQPREIIRWRPLTEDVPPPHCSGKKAILGHTADTSGEIFSVGHLVCIDTYCYGGQWLTALEVESGQLWQANNLGKLREQIP